MRVESSIERRAVDFMGGWRRYMTAAVQKMLCLVLVGCASVDATHPTDAAPALTEPAGSASAPSSASEPTSPTPSPPPITYPVAGNGRFLTAAVEAAIAGKAGPLLRYQVAVEADIAGVDVTEFAGQVADVLSDPRGWTGTGQWRLQLVPDRAPHDFVIYLATPATRDVLCDEGYDRYTSCRNGNNVVVNVARWVHGVPHYGADLTTYRQYIINHDTGHRLGRGHELCPGPGRPAPVMQQQTLGLHGCVANSWPIVDGKPYSGRSGQYDDPIPRDP